MTGIDQPNPDALLGVGDSLIGTVLDGRFRVDDLLGRGGMSAVYKAYNLSMDKPVAIKVLLKTLNDEAALQRFRREARALCQVKHKHLVEVFQLGVTADLSPYMVIEYLEGESLAERIARVGALDARWSCKTIIEICAGLAEAHKQGILHRDIKPGNIMIATTADGGQCAKLVDFGIAKIEQADTDGKLTQTGSVLGSPAYMSPEQCQGKQIDARSEVYALGCVLFEMLAGHEPFRSDSLLEVMSKHETTDAELPSAANLPDDLANIVYRCLEKDPAHRYEHVEQLSHDLQSFLDGGATRAGVRRRQQQQRKPINIGRAGRMQVAVILVVVGLGVLLVPPSRAWIVKQLIALSPNEAATTLLKENLGQTLRQCGDARSLQEAGALELAEASTTKDAQAKGSHLKAAADCFSAAGDRPQALSAAKQRIECFSGAPDSPHIVAHWTAVMDYLWLKSEDEQTSEVKLESMQGAEALRDSIDNTDNEAAKAPLGALYGRYIRSFFSPSTGRFRDQREYDKGLENEAMLPVQSRNHERAADNMQALLRSQKAFQHDEFVARRAYKDYLSVLFKLERYPQAVAVGREARTAFPLSDDMEAIGREGSTDALNEQQKYAEAVEEMRPLRDKILGAGHSKLSIAPETQASCMFNYCRACNKLNKSDLVINDIVRAEQLGVSSSRLQLEKAAALMKQKRMREAEATLDDVLHHRTFEGKIGITQYWFEQLAICQIDRGDRKAAAATLEEGLEIGWHKAKKRHHEADLKRCLDLALMAASIYRRTKQYTADLDLWKKQLAALQEAPQALDRQVMSRTYQQLAIAFANCGQESEAAAARRQADLFK